MASKSSSFSLSGMMRFTARDKSVNRGVKAKTANNVLQSKQARSSKLSKRLGGL